MKLLLFCLIFFCCWIVFRLLFVRWRKDRVQSKYRQEVAALYCGGIAEGKPFETVVRDIVSAFNLPSPSELATDALECQHLSEGFNIAMGIAQPSYDSQHLISLSMIIEEIYSLNYLNQLGVVPGTFEAVKISMNRLHANEQRRKIGARAYMRRVQKLAQSIESIRPHFAARDLKRLPEN